MLINSTIKFITFITSRIYYKRRYIYVLLIMLGKFCHAEPSVKMSVVSSIDKVINVFMQKIKIS